MENISLGQIAITSLITFYKSFVSKILKPIHQKIDQIDQKSSTSRNNMELELIKIILVNFINDIEKGINKSAIQIKNAYELYDRYKTLGGNSYVHDSFEKLIKEGKI